MFHMIRVSDVAMEGSGLNDMPADVAAILAFTKADDHYTYTFDPNRILELRIKPLKKNLS